jgi:predicted metal-binding membrane protein
LSHPVFAALSGDGREQRVVLGALVALVALSWLWLWLSPMPMPGTSGGLRTAHYAAVTFAMWFVMMIGMMTPSAAPTLMLYDRVQRHSGVDGAGALTACFLLGYLAVWGAFSVLATLVQIELISGGWIDAMRVATRRTAMGVLLVGVGLYQWLPIKRACLERCRSPAEFIAAYRRPGRPGAWRMGVRHGLYCLGCCWALMLLLFVGGVMNLLWVAAITAVVLAEKLLAAEWIRHAIGVSAVLSGVIWLSGAAG